MLFLLKIVAYFLFFSFSFFFFQIIFLANLGNSLSQGQAMVLGLSLVIYVLIGIIVFIDFITMGIFKKIEDKTVNKIYGYIFTFYGWTTLTFLYRPLLYNFLDNRYTKRLFFFSIPYIIIILISSSLFSNNNFAYYPPNSNVQKYGNTVDRMNYEDLRNEYLSEVSHRISRRRYIIPNITLNKYFNDEDYLSLFLKMDPTDYKLIQNNTDIDPYWKTGFNFSLFSSDKYEDRFYRKGKAKMEIEFDSIRIIKRDLRKKKRKTKDSTLIKQYDVEIDSLSAYMENKRNKFKEKGVIFEEQKQDKIINSFLDLIELELNGYDIKADLDCFFFKHSNNNEKGLLCLYPMDSLSLGKQELYYYKEVKTQSENVNKDIDIKLPFYKIRSFN